jgi:glycosyltransferase involved in cell wall biosynthesis
MKKFRRAIAERQEDPAPLPGNNQKEFNLSDQATIYATRTYFHYRKKIGIVFKDAPRPATHITMYGDVGSEHENAVMFSSDSEESGVRLEFPLDPAESLGSFAAITFTVPGRETRRPALDVSRQLRVRLIERRREVGDSKDKVRMVARGKLDVACRRDGSLYVVWSTEIPDTVGSSPSSKETGKYYISIELRSVLGIIWLTRVSKSRAELSRHAPDTTVVSAVSPNDGFPNSQGVEGNGSVVVTGLNEKKLFSSSPKVNNEIDRDITGKARVAVCTWSLGHNAAGRAATIAGLLSSEYDVSLFGPLFKRYGETVWGPIKKSDLGIYAFAAETMDDVQFEAERIAAENRFDLVVVVKPRGPGMMLGGVIAKQSNCAVIVDIDEDELSFVSPPQLRASRYSNAYAPDSTTTWPPYSAHVTGHCYDMAMTADGITVSNIALQRRHGGILLRHARDEALFNPALYNKLAIRASMGIPQNEKVILFHGTVRRHKGLLEVISAIRDREISDTRLYISGDIKDEVLKSELKGAGGEAVAFLPPTSMDDAAAVVSIADAVCAFQDKASYVSEYQIPAKISDALAMGVPVIASDCAPLEDLALSGGIIRVRDVSELISVISQVSEGRISAQKMPHLRAIYLSELSYSVNRARLRTAVSSAIRRHEINPGDRGEWIERLTKVGRGQLLPNRLGADGPRLGVSSPAEGPTPGTEAFVFSKTRDVMSVFNRQVQLVAAAGARGRFRSVNVIAPPIIVQSDEELDAIRSSGCDFDPHSCVIRSKERHWLCGEIEVVTLVQRGVGTTASAFGRRIPSEAEFPERLRALWGRNGQGGSRVVLVPAGLPHVTAISEVMRPDVFILDIDWDGYLDFCDLDVGHVQVISETPNLVTCRSLSHPSLRYLTDLSLLVIPDGRTPLFGLEHREVREDVSSNHVPSIFIYTRCLKGECLRRIYQLKAGLPGWEVSVVMHEEGGMFQSAPREVSISRFDSIESAAAELERATAVVLMVDDDCGDPTSTVAVMSSLCRNVFGCGESLLAQGMPWFDLHYDTESLLVALKRAALNAGDVELHVSSNPPGWEEGGDRLFAAIQGATH